MFIVRIVFRVKDYGLNFSLGMRQFCEFGLSYLNFLSLFFYVLNVDDSLLYGFVVMINETICLVIVIKVFNKWYLLVFLNILF